MLEGPDAPTLAEDAARRKDWSRVEHAYWAAHRATDQESRFRALSNYQTEIAAFTARYWTDMRRTFGGTTF